MTQYNTLNVRLSNSQLNKLKSAVKNETDVVLRISSGMVGNSNDNTNSPHKLLLTDRQVANIFLITYEQMLNFQKLNYQK